MQKDRLYNILTSDNIEESIQNNLSYLLEIIPELKDMIDFPHNHPHHHLDVWNHTLFALSLSQNDFEIRLSLLLHDIGKPHSYQDGEIRHFKGHPKKSAETSKNILERLEFSEEEINKICYLVETHDTPITNKEIEDNLELTITKFKIQCCDALAHHPAKLEKRIKYLLSIYSKINDKLPCKKLILN